MGTTKQKAKSPFKSYDEAPGRTAMRVDLDEQADTASSASFTLSPQEETERDNAEEREPAVKPAAEVPERVKAKKATLGQLRKTADAAASWKEHAQATLRKERSPESE